MLIVQLDLEHRVGQRLQDCGLYLDGIFFRHKSTERRLLVISLTAPSSLMATQAYPGFPQATGIHATGSHPAGDRAGKSVPGSSGSPTSNRINLLTKKR